MDLVIAVSGLFAAFSFAWIVAVLFGALILGVLVATLFGSIFYGTSRLAHAVAGDAEETTKSGRA